jgi:hypothetical protein
MFIPLTMTIINKIISSGFVNDCGIIAKPRIYHYEGMPYVGYVIYLKKKFFWFYRYKIINAVPDIEDLRKEYEGIEIVY